MNSTGSALVHTDFHIDLPQEDTLAGQYHGSQYRAGLWVLILHIDNKTHYCTDRT